MRGPDLRNALVLTTLAALIRFPTLDQQSFDRNEAITVETVLSPGLWDTLRHVGGETSPPLYYVLTWVWSQLFGLGEAAMRFPSALAAVAAVPVAYEIGRLTVSRRAAIVAAGLVATNPLLFWFSLEARPYALLVLLSALSFLFFVKALERQGRDHLAWWVVASLLAVATHYFAGFLVVYEAAWLLYRAADRRSALKAVGALAALCAPLIPLMIHQAVTGGAGWLGTIEMADRLRQVGEKFLTGATGPNIELPAALAAGALVGLGLLLLLTRADGRERHGGLSALAAGGAVVVIPVAVAVVGPDYVLDRNFLPALVPVAVVVAAGMGARQASLVGLPAAVALCALFLAVVIGVIADPELQRSDWRGAVHAMGPPQGDRAILAPFNEDYPLLLYAPGSHEVRDGGARVSEVVVFGDVEPGEVPLPRGFRPVERRELDSFRMTRFRASRPLRVERRRLVATDFGGACDPGAARCEYGVLVLQRAAAET